MQPAKPSDRSNPFLLAMAVTFVVLGLSATLRDGQITGTFWLYVFAANVAGFMVAFKRKSQFPRLRCILSGTEKLLYIIMFFGIVCRMSAGAGAAIWVIERVRRDAVRTSFVNTALLLGMDKNGTYGPLEFSVLSAAVYQSQKRSAYALLEAGADPNQANARGWTPLSIARYQGDEEMATLLIQYGAMERSLPVLPKKKQ